MYLIKIRYSQRKSLGIFGSPGLCAEWSWCWRKARFRVLQRRRMNSAETILRPVMGLIKTISVRIAIQIAETIVGWCSGALLLWDYHEVTRKTAGIARTHWKMERLGILSVFSHLLKVDRFKSWIAHIFMTFGTYILAPAIHIRSSRTESHKSLLQELNSQAIYLQLTSFGIV